MGGARGSVVVAVMLLDDSLRGTVMVILWRKKNVHLCMRFVQ